MSTMTSSTITSSGPTPLSGQGLVIHIIKEDKKDIKTSTTTNNDGGTTTITTKDDKEITITPDKEITITPASIATQSQSKPKLKPSLVQGKFCNNMCGDSTFNKHKNPPAVLRGACPCSGNYTIITGPRTVVTAQTQELLNEGWSIVGGVSMANCPFDVDQHAIETGFLFSDGLDVLKNKSLNTSYNRCGVCHDELFVYTQTLTKSI